MHVFLLIAFLIALTSTCRVLSSTGMCVIFMRKYPAACSKTEKSFWLWNRFSRRQVKCLKKKIQMESLQKLPYQKQRELLWERSYKDKSHIVLLTEICVSNICDICEVVL